MPLLILTVVVLQIISPIMTHNPQDNRRIDSNDIRLLQWNCQGCRNKKYDINNLIETYKPSVVTLQETMLSANNPFNVSNYNCVRADGHFNRRAHGGVAVFVHESLPYLPVQLNTELQAVAVTVQLSRKITICSIYNSRSHSLTEQLLNNLINQLPAPIILMGDFNSYSPLWGSSSTDARGRAVESFIETNSLNVLNNGSPTRVGFNSESAIDLTIISPTLASDCNWEVLPSPRDSDHNPIQVCISTNNRVPPQETLTFRNFKKANWDLFGNHQVWKTLPSEAIINNSSAAQLLEDLYSRFNTALNDTTPVVKLSKFYPKPWWSPEVKEAFEKREKAYKIYRQNKSPQNFTKWKKTKAEYRKKSTIWKKESWQKTASEINCNTPLSKVWESIGKIKGRVPRKISMLKDGPNIITTLPEICNKLAEAFSTVSKNSNYSQEFQQIKTRCEQNPLDFSSNNVEPYNEPFSLSELKFALSKTSNTSPGPDEITNKMLKTIPMEAAEHLLKVINRIYADEIFPDQWKDSIIVPIPKPNKDHSSATNYRPISLTSVLCKTMERMINNRLVDYLETVLGYGRVQCGGTKNRSTIDHLVRMETVIRRAFANNQHLVSVFFDLEKAYDTTWRYGILRDLFNHGLRGHLPIFIRNFLQERRFSVRLGGCMSGEHQQETGVPQGSVLSVTLFVMKIDQIVNQIPADLNFHSSLFVDDLQISYTHTDLNVVEEKLQAAIDRVSNWASMNGFKFSASKTFAIHFTKIPGIHLPPTIKLNGTNIPVKESGKFLGLVFDSKLTWKPHIAQLKTNCTKALNILKSLVSTNWGADQEMLMHLYRALVRSRLDYGAIVYGSACDTTLKTLDVIPNDAMRAATGALKSSPIASLQVLTNEKPLKLRRQLQALKFYFKKRGQLSNPGFMESVSATQRTLFLNRGMTPPFPNRVENILSELNIEKGSVRPNFSYLILNINKPSWKIQLPEICLELTEYPRSSTTSIIYQQLFNNLLSEKFSNFEHIYTDGSKTEEGVGAAAVWRTTTKTTTLPSEASIYTAELCAINMARNIIEENSNRNFVIFSDSLSNLQMLSTLNPKNALARKLQHDFENFALGDQTVVLCWVPGHVGISGNEKADEAAKTATRGIKTFYALPHSDYYAIVNDRIQRKWQEEWTRSRSKLLEVRPKIGPWKKRKLLPRKQQVKLNRLRLGHTLVTHSYLFDNEVQQGPPPCPLCMNAILTVKHILTQCDSLKDLRRQFFESETPSLEKLLKDGDVDQALFPFLQEINVSNLI